jgi:hypothetical protein
MLENGYTVWEGASLLDNSPIFLVLTGFVFPTSNRRTGRQIQSWILQQESTPTKAAKEGLHLENEPNKCLLREFTPSK